MENTNQSTALLVLDIQGATVNRLTDSAPLIKALTKAIQTARANKMPVIYVVIGFRKGYPEMSPNNKMHAMLKSGAMSLDSEESYRVHASVAPQPDDIVITKKRVSSFAGSDLEVVLRSLGIKHLVLTGIATSRVVLATLREAADKDFILTVLSDCCADMDEEVHRMLTTKLFLRDAEVITADEWSASNQQ